MKGAFLVVVSATRTNVFALGVKVIGVLCRHSSAKLLARSDRLNRRKIPLIKDKNKNDVDPPLLRCAMHSMPMRNLGDNLNAY